MKLTVHDAVVDVAFNPANKNDGRPDAGMTYTASLRVDSTTGGARLTVGTDFTPPCVLAVLPEWSTDLASETLAMLGFWAPARNDGWLVARPDVYAYADGVRYGDGTEEELAFMASFGFTPGARFNLALPMLRAQRAQWLSGDIVQTQPSNLDAALTAMAGVDDSGHPLEFVMAVPDAAMTVDEVDAAQQALEYPNVSGGGVPESPVAAPMETLPEPPKAAPIRRRRAVKPAGKVEIVSQVLGTPTEETFVNPAAVDPIPGPVGMLDDEDNPFAIGGV